MAKSFDEPAKRTMSAKARKRAVGRSKELLAQCSCPKFASMPAKAKANSPPALGIKEPSLSKLENQDDMQISTLKKIIEALGGEVQITARFPTKQMRIKPFDTATKPAKKRRELQLV